MVQARKERGMIRKLVYTVVIILVMMIAAIKIAAIKIAAYINIAFT